jgi:hypothetical protein
MASALKRISTSSEDLCRPHPDPRQAQIEEPPGQGWRGVDAAEQFDSDA